VAAAHFDLIVAAGGSLDKDAFWRIPPTSPFILSTINGGSGTDTFVMNGTHNPPFGPGA
jgi:hypothetical protein